MIRRAVAVAVLVVAAMSASAWAQPVSDEARARGATHFEAGRAAAERGDHATAAREYTAAYMALRDGRILYYLARENEQLGLYRRAAVFYRRYLAEVDVPEAHRAQVEASIAKLDARAPKPVAPKPVAPTPVAPTPVAPKPAPEVTYELRCPFGAPRGDAPPLGLVQWCERNGAMHGPFAAWYPSGAPKARGEYAYGQRTGTWTFWYDSGKPKARGAFRGGQRDGTWTYYHDSGTVSARGLFVRGQRSGRWEHLDASGRPVSQP